MNKLIINNYYRIFVEKITTLNYDEKQEKLQELKKLIDEDYDDEFNEFYHNGHEQCGDYICVDAGGGLQDEPNEYDYINFIEYLKGASNAKN